MSNELIATLQEAYAMLRAIEHGKPFSIAELRSIMERFEEVIDDCITLAFVSEATKAVEDRDYQHMHYCSSVWHYPIQLASIGMSVRERLKAFYLGNQ